MKKDGTDLVGGFVGTVSCLYDGANITHYVTTVIDVDTTPAVTYQNYKFIQTEDLTEAGVAVHPYGGFIIPAGQIGESLKAVVEFDGDLYDADLDDLIEVGTTITFEKVTE